MWTPIKGNGFLDSHPFLVAGVQQDRYLHVWRVSRSFKETVKVGSSKNREAIPYVACVICFHLTFIVSETKQKE